MKRLNQPFVVAYMVAGVVLGPYVLEFVTDTELLNRIGAFGVLFLLFFVGAEISLPSLVKNWRIMIAGTVLQVVISIVCVWALGFWLSWPMSQIIFLGFVISLSSTAVIITMLKDRNETNSFVGQNVIGILLVQDFLLIPMLIAINLIGGGPLNITKITLQIVGALLILALLIWLLVKKDISLPFSKYIKRYQEVQTLIALFLGLGMAFITGLFGLSAALGAFLAGIIVSVAKETHWIQQSLESFRGIFVALFFVSIGMTVDLQFLAEYWFIILALMLASLLTNTFINAGILKSLRVTVKDSLYAGALLSQIGEFSFVLAAIGLQTNIINEFAYQTTIATIFATLLMSPAWIGLIKRYTSRMA
jgi:CPA2 family monovalent cation:H+ antiporter-2